MRRVAVAMATALLSVFALFGVTIPSAFAQGNAALQNPCAAPNEIGNNSIEEVAWQLWVAATCPVNDNQYPYVVWENWIEQ